MIIPSIRTRITAKKGWTPFTIKVAQPTEATPIIEPALISIPPVMMTMVMPTAAIPFTATWRRILKMLVELKNPSVVTEKKISRTNSAINMANCDNTSDTLPFFFFII